MFKSSKLQEIYNENVAYQQEVKENLPTFLQDIKNVEKIIKGLKTNCNFEPKNLSIWWCHGSQKILALNASGEQIPLTELPYSRLSDLYLEELPNLLKFIYDTQRGE